MGTEESNLLEAEGLVVLTPEGGTLCFYFDNETGHSYRVHRYAERPTGIVTEWDFDGKLIDKSHYH